MRLHKILHVATLGALLACSGAVHAMPVLQGTPTAATGFLNLDIGGELYNMTFRPDQSFLLLYNPPEEAGWWGDLSAAETIGVAISMALTDNNVTGIAGLDPFLPNTYSATFGLPTAVSVVGSGLDVDGYLGYLGTNPGDTWQSSTDGMSTLGGPDFYANVVLERSTVPAPSSALLLAPIVLGLAIRRRRST